MADRDSQVVAPIPYKAGGYVDRCDCGRGIAGPARLFAAHPYHPLSWAEKALCGAISGPGEGVVRVVWHPWCIRSDSRLMEGIKPLDASSKPHQVP